MTPEKSEAPEVAASEASGPIHHVADQKGTTIMPDSTDNPWPVDSTVTEGAGIPGPDLARLIRATIPAEVPLPLGANPASAGEWDDDGPQGRYRLVWSEPMPLPEELATEDVRVVATQLVDGTIVAEGTDQPLVYVGISDYTIHASRALAQAILDAADLADRWRSNETGAGL